VAFLTAESVSATFECVNKGGNVAPGHPAFESAVQGPTQHITPHQGQITFSVTIPPPPTPSPKTECPNGNWKVHLLSLTFTNVVLHVDVLTKDLGTIDP